MSIYTNDRNARSLLTRLLPFQRSSMRLWDCTCSHWEGVAWLEEFSKELAFEEFQISGGEEFEEITEDTVGLAVMEELSFHIKHWRGGATSAKVGWNSRAPLNIFAWRWPFTKMQLLHNFMAFLDLSESFNTLCSLSSKDSTDLSAVERLGLMKKLHVSEDTEWYWANIYCLS